MDKAFKKNNPHGEADACNAPALPQGRSSWQNWKKIKS
jgi:hypothetical protein